LVASLSLSLGGTYDPLSMNAMLQSNNPIVESVMSAEELGTISPKKHVTVAINYQVSLVDDFVGLLGPQTTQSQIVTAETTAAVATTPSESIANNKAAPEESLQRQDSSNDAFPSTNSASGNNNSTRRSNRDKIGKKREVSFARTQVRYDMLQVPHVSKNSEFLSLFEKWWTDDSQRKRKRSASQEVANDDDNDAPPGENNNHDNSLLLSAAPRRSTRLSHVASNVEPNEEEEEDHDVLSQEIFAGNTSVIWVPTKRSEWEDCISEMTAVCTVAEARRRLLLEQEGRANGTSSAKKKPFHAPLSRDYICDRVDIDEPMYGYQLRHKTGGWLQGFIMWTNFTTWTHYFKWDSNHPKSGMPLSAAASDKSAPMDLDGSLTTKLEALPRTGNPMEGGVVFPNVAEISLVGGLGCGEYMLRMALDDIMRDRSNRAPIVSGNGSSQPQQPPYKFVVLQATESSRKFYERFGFVRVGAICRYHSNKAKGGRKMKGRNKNVNQEKPDAETPGEVVSKPVTVAEPPIVGYRHWTHANESDASLQMHGGPSYMMCLELPDLDELDSLALATRLQAGEEEKKEDRLASGKKVPAETRVSFLDAMMGLSVSSKPVVSRLGGDDIGSSMSQLAAMKTNTIESTPSSSSRQIGRSKPAQTTASSKKKPFEALLAPVEGKPAAKRKSGPSLAKQPRADILSGAKRKRAQQEGATPKNGRKPKNNKTPTSTAASEWETPEPASSGKRRRKNLTPTTSKSVKGQVERVYHSVRGPDGRFMRVPVIDGVPMMIETTSTAKKKKKPSPPPAEPKSAPRKKKVASTSGAQKRIDRATLRKQKVKAYPRNRPHFYNRVVKRIGKKGKKKEYFFVLNYSEEAEEMCLVPMSADGDIMMGKRQGRPRFQCVLGDTSENFVTVPCNEFEVVPATMIMKTPIVSQEAWDIEDE